MKRKQSSKILPKTGENSEVKEMYLVTIEIEDFLKVKDALLRAIEAFNMGNFKNEPHVESNFKIVKEVERYSVKIAKKSGKANLELPQLGLDNILKDLKIERVAVILEEAHTYPLDTSKMSNGLQINKSSGSSNDKEETFLEVKSKKKCCGLCIIY